MRVFTPKLLALTHLLTLLAAAPSFAREVDETLSINPVYTVNTQVSGQPVTITVTQVEVPTDQISTDLDSQALEGKPAGLNDQVITIDEALENQGGKPRLGWRMRVHKFGQAVKARFVSAREVASEVWWNTKSDPRATAKSFWSRSSGAVYKWLFQGVDLEKFEQDPIQNYQYGTRYKLFIRIQQAATITTLIFSPKLALSGMIMRIFVDMVFTEVFSLNPERWPHLMSLRAQKQIDRLKAEGKTFTVEEEKEFLEKGRRRMDTWVGQPLASLISVLALYGLNQPRLVPVVLELAGLLALKFVGSGGVRNIMGRYWLEKKNNHEIPISTKDLMVLQALPRLWNGPLESLGSQLFKTVGTATAVVASLNFGGILEHMGPVTDLLANLHLLDPTGHLAQVYSVPLGAVRFYVLLGAVQWAAYFWRDLSDWAVVRVARSIRAVTNAAKAVSNAVGRTDLITIGPSLAAAYAASSESVGEVELPTDSAESGIGVSGGVACLNLLAIERTSE